MIWTNLQLGQQNMFRLIFIFFEEPYSSSPHRGPKQWGEKWPRGKSWNWPFLSIKRHSQKSYTNLKVSVMWDSDIFWDQGSKRLVLIGKDGFMLYFQKGIFLNPFHLMFVNPWKHCNFTMLGGQKTSRCWDGVPLHPNSKCSCGY